MPKPPTGWSMLPNRHDFTQSQPRSSTGSPRCESSQSSTARMPSGPTMKLPLRKSPCTRRVGASAPVRDVVLEPAQSELERRVRLAERRRGSRGTAGSARSPPGPGARGSGPHVDGVDLRGDRAALAGQARGARRRIRRREGSGGGWSRRRRGPSRTRRRGRRPSSSRNRTVGTGTPAAAAASRSRYSVERSDWPRFEPGSRRSTSACRGPPSTTASNDQLSRDAPPESRRSPSTVHRLAEMARAESRRSGRCRRGGGPRRHASGARDDARR